MIIYSPPLEGCPPGGVVVGLAEKTPQKNHWPMLIKPDCRGPDVKSGEAKSRTELTEVIQALLFLL